MAIFGSLLVITAFTCFKKLRSVPFWMATRISIWLGSVSWMNNSLLYRSFIAVDVFSGIASIFHLLLISLQRLYAIAYPVRHRVSSTSSYLIAVAVTWSVAFLATTAFIPGKTLIQLARFLVLLFSCSLNINLHRLCHDVSPCEISKTRLLFFEQTQRSKTHPNGLPCHPSLHCCLDTIHDHKHYHFLLWKMLHARQSCLFFKALSLQQFGDEPCGVQPQNARI